jgi:hypothetical protein
MEEKKVKKDLGISTGFSSSLTMGYWGRNWRTGIGFL